MFQLKVLPATAAYPRQPAIIRLSPPELAERTLQSPDPICFPQAQTIVRHLLTAPPPAAGQLAMAIVRPENPGRAQAAAQISRKPRPGNPIPGNPPKPPPIRPFRTAGSTQPIRTWSAIISSVRRFIRASSKPISEMAEFMLLRLAANGNIDLASKSRARDLES